MPLALNNLSLNARANTVSELFSTTADKEILTLSTLGKISSQITYLYNFDPIKPHFYMVKLSFIGVNIIFLISAQNIDCGYLLEPPWQGGSNEYSQSMF